MTQPVRLSRRATSRVKYRNPTPWTRPLIRTSKDAVCSPRATGGGSALIAKKWHGRKNERQALVWLALHLSRQCLRQRPSHGRCCLIGDAEVVESSTIRTIRRTRLVGATGFLERGKTIGIVGESGSGKSVTSQAI